MAQKTIPVEHFNGAVDANTPLFNRDPGWLKTLQNFRLKPGGWLEARGGYDAIKPAGGTTAPIYNVGTGFVAGAFEHVQSTGCILGTANNTVFSRDIALEAYYRLFGPADNVGADPPVVGTNVNNTTHIWYFGSVGPFSRLRFNIQQGCGGGSTYVITWEYRSSSGGGTWQPITSPFAPTENFKTAGIRDVDWNPTTDWVPVSVGSTYLYWVRARVSTIGVATQDCWGGLEPITSDWPGRRIVLGAATTTTVGSGTLTRLYGQDTATPGNAVWMFESGNGGLGFAGGSNVRGQSRTRFASLQNRIMRVDGLIQRRFDLLGWYELGFPAPNLSAFGTVATPAVPNFGQVCRFGYAITFGGGPAGAWGESGFTNVGQSVFGAGDQATVSWTFNVTPAIGECDIVYVYRTDDLTGVPVSDRNNQPMYRIAVLNRSVTGVLPITYTDSTYGFPFPAKQMEISDPTPPPRCRLIKVYQSRVILGSSDQYPSRFWWSEQDQGENFPIKDENFADLAYTGGGALTGLEVAFSTVFAWNQNRMIGATDLDEPVPNIYEVPGGVGSIAIDGVAEGSGALMWLGRDGVYMMDAQGRIANVSEDQRSVFGKMSTLTHGGSRASIYNNMYDVLLMDNDGNPVGSQPHWRYDLLKGGWAQVTHLLAPFGSALAPLGHADQGVPHPMLANATVSVSDRNLNIGEYTTQDGGANFNCIADIHFGPPRFVKFSPRRFAAYYQADAGWGTPTAGVPPGASYIFKTVSGVGTPVAHAGTDYSLVVGNMKEKTSGSQDVAVRFTATTTGSGTTGNQRLIACYLDGNIYEVHPTS